MNIPMHICQFIYIYIYIYAPIYRCIYNILSLHALHTGTNLRVDMYENICICLYLY
jgi:hypothetical protein